MTLTRHDQLTLAAAQQQADAMTAMAAALNRLAQAVEHLAVEAARRNDQEDKSSA